MMMMEEEEMVLNLAQEPGPEVMTLYKGRSLDPRLVIDAYGSVVQAKACSSCDLRLYCNSGKFVRVHRSLMMALSPFLAKVCEEVLSGLLFVHLH